MSSLAGRGVVPDSALDRHVSFVRHIRDEDKQGDDEDGFYALEGHGFFAEFGFSHVAESIKVGFVLAKPVYECKGGWGLGCDKVANWAGCSWFLRLICALK